MVRWAAPLLAPVLLVVMLLLQRDGRPTYFLGDFRAFYCAGAAVAHGQDPYRVEPLRSCQRTAGPPAQPAFLRDVAVPAPLPPPALVVFAAFARLPFPAAAALYLALCLAAMTVASSAVARLTGVPAPAVHVLFAAITATVTLFVGQPVPLVLAALAGAALAARAGRPWLAAAGVLAATIEPHVALPAIAALAIGMPRTRVPLALGGALLAALGIATLGPTVSLEYLTAVLPAHALANANEWQYSLTSVLTSFGVAAPAAVRAGEIMYAAMLIAGVAIARRLAAGRSDAAALVLVAPAFAVFGGVHVHVQQIAVAFPAMLYVLGPRPDVRAAVVCGLSLAMIPWNVLGATVLAGVAPLLVGAFAAATWDLRRSVTLAAVAGAIVASVVVLAALGYGPVPHVFHAPPVDPAALAETSWAAFSNDALARPSALTQWLRIPTLLGLACGLAAVAVSALRPPVALQRVRP